MTWAPSLPTQWSKGAKWLVYSAISPPITGAVALYDAIATSDESPPTEWRYLQWRFQRMTPVGTEEDVAIITMNIVNVTGGNNDPTWTAGDYTACEAAITELWTALKVHVNPSHTLTRIDWYVRAFNPEVPVGQDVRVVPGPGQKQLNRFVRSGPPVHMTVINQAGSGIGAQEIYQAAMSVTFKTATRPHWGRLYVPGMGTSEIGGSQGRFDLSRITDVANKFAEFQDDLAQQGFHLVVPATQQDHLYAQGLNWVTDIVVDDIPDVIRRRRPKQAVSKVSGVPTP
jgi:hypothetical protein